MRSRRCARAPVLREPFVRTLFHRARLWSFGDDASATLAGMQASSVTGSHERRWVLLVDDHDDGRELLEEFLSFSGYEVEACGSGEEALERIARYGAPSVVVTDLSMGPMSGTDLARSLRADMRTASVPILAVTGHAGFEDRERLFEAILVKPIALPELTAQLERAIAR